VIAALYVMADGPYSGLPDVECWALPERDAREYAGPWPVVAHPPCARWGSYWGGSPTGWPRKRKGDDDGCFKAALESVRTWGGVLEHPAGSWAWRFFSLCLPPRSGGWVAAGDGIGGWTCCVEQGHYGHRARKATWLYAAKVSLPSLRWGPSGKRVRMDDGYHSAAERRRAIKTGAIKTGRLSKRQRAETPAEFRDLLLSIARPA
jgi:hypothetical protein